MVQLKGDPKRMTAYLAGGTIKIGDFVQQNSDGEVVVATTSGALVGIAMVYAEDGDEVQIADHPDQVFRIGCSAAIAQTNVNQNANIVANTTLGPEGNHVLDESSLAGTATLQLKVLELSRRLGAVAGMEAYVKINNHALAGGTGTAGV